MLISSVYASLLALLIVWLSLQVIKLRQSKQILLGDGGEVELQRAIRAQANATEYIPITLILLVSLELNQAALFLIHGGGIAILVSRLIHARSLPTSRVRDRVLGMQITIWTIILLACLNLGYLIYHAFRPLG